MNVLFSGNDVHTTGNQNDPSGWGFIVADVYGTSSYYSYTGNIQIITNAIQCVANANNCLLLVSHATVASGNTITATGSATGMYVADGFANVTNNKIQIGRGTGILLYSPPYTAATVTNNTLSGTGRVGIYIGSLPASNTTGYNMHGNNIIGFATPISIDPH
jgi:hypothetical protein